MLFPLMLTAQNNPVILKGKVIDSADGGPLIGASVIVEGTKFGTITDVDGTYELSIPQEKYEVVFSCLGYDDLDEDGYVTEMNWKSGSTQCRVRYIYE